MEQDAAGEFTTRSLEIGSELLGQVENLTELLLRPWNAYQIGIALGLFVLAQLLGGVLSRRLEAWMRTRKGWPKWRYRLLLLIKQRMRMILFALFAWITVTIMRELTWPSRSYILHIVANLALAWLIVAFATRLISNTFLRNIVQYGAWAWITLNILGLRDETVGLLDSAGFEMADFRISVWTLLQAAFVLGVFFFIARTVSQASSTQIERSKELSPSMKVLIVKVLQVALYGIAFVMSMRAVGVDLTGLAVLSGAIGVGLGFGLQKVVSNLVSGVIILLDKSVKPGDVISLGETFGWIHALGARYVSVVTRDGKEYLIPNEDLITGQVVNWSHSNDFVRLDIHFGCAYHDDPHDVRRIAIEAAGAVDRVLKDRVPVCHITGFGDSSVDYVLRFWIRDPTGGLTNIRGNVFLALWDAFQSNGISIPFPQREVKLLEGSQVKAVPVPE